MTVAARRSLAVGDVALLGLAGVLFLATGAVRFVVQGGNGLVALVPAVLAAVATAAAARRLDHALLAGLVVLGAAWPGLGAFAVAALGAAVWAAWVLRHPAPMVLAGAAVAVPGAWGPTVFAVASAASFAFVLAQGPVAVRWVGAVLGVVAAVGSAWLGGSVVWLAVPIGAFVVVALAERGMRPSDLRAMLHGAAGPAALAPAGFLLVIAVTDRAAAIGRGASVVLGWSALGLGLGLALAVRGLAVRSFHDPTRAFWAAVFLSGGAAVGLHAAQGDLTAAPQAAALMGALAAPLVVDAATRTKGRGLLDRTTMGIRVLLAALPWVVVHEVVRSGL